VLERALLRLGGAGRSTLGSFARQKTPAQDDYISFFLKRRLRMMAFFWIKINGSGRGRPLHIGNFDEANGAAFWLRFLFVANLTLTTIEGIYDSETRARVGNLQAAGRVGGALFYGAGGGARIAGVEALWGLGELRRRGGVGGSGARGTDSAGAGEVHGL